MSQLNINNLPNELLTEIFRMLDAVDLENATLACKLWNILIESGCRWSVSVIGNDNVQKMNFILTTRRRIGKITISNGCLSEDNQVFEIFRRQGFNVAQLRLCCCHITFVVFAQLLKLTPNLESLDIEMMKIDNVTDVPLDPVLPELKKLKILTMTMSPIIQCFSNAKLTTIRIIDAKAKCEKPFVDFPSSQPSFTIDNERLTPCPRSILAQVGKLDVPIPFQSGTIILGDRISSQDHDNLVRFIESQADSLREVHLRLHFPHSLYESVFNRLTKLRTLIVSLDDMTPGSYDRLKENRSVSTMSLESEKWLSEIVSRLPNIRRLILPGYCIVKPSAVVVMVQHLSQLESLSIRLFFNSFGILKCGNLRRLHIEFLIANINWNEFTKANPRLVELTIEYITTIDDGPLLTSDDIDQITTNVDLQYLRLGTGFVADDRFFEIIRAKCTNLKVLELQRSCVPHGLRHNVEINVLRLYDKIDSF